MSMHVMNGSNGTPPRSTQINPTRLAPNKLRIGLMKDTTGTVRNTQFNWKKPITKSIGSWLHEIPPHLIRVAYNDCFRNFVLLFLFLYFSSCSDLLPLFSIFVCPFTPQFKISIVKHNLKGIRLKTNLLNVLPQHQLKGHQPYPLRERQNLRKH